MIAERLEACDASYGFSGTGLDVIDIVVVEEAEVGRFCSARAVSRD